MAGEVAILDSILLSIKQKIGLERDAPEFDSDVIMAINSVLGILFQLGIGEEGYHISDENDTWDDYLGSATNLEMVKDYIALKVGLIFDPPQSGTLVEVKNQLIKELEWRINVTVDPGKE